MIRLALPLVALLCANPLAAKDSLGVFSSWAAFRDATVPQCYAIASPEPSSKERTFEPFVTIASWPARRIRGQVHFRMSYALRPNSQVSLRIGNRRFVLLAGKADAWGRNAGEDAAIRSAMRNAGVMRISATAANGRRFTETYALPGAATAMDAAELACNGPNR